MTALLLLTLAWPAAAKDIYKNMAQLRAAVVEDKDYRVEWEARGSSVVVLAVHGGLVEPGTSEVLREVAGKDLSYYLFEALKPPTRWPHELHVTSNNFDDPPAVALTTAATTAVSIHGAKDEDEKTCIGGLNAYRRARVAAALEKAGFAVEEPCERLPGIKKRNIANKARARGVQLELSKGLRLKILKDRKLLKKYGRAVREGLK